MAGPRAEKVAVVDEVKGHLEDADAAILAEYRGLKVAELASLRRALRAAGAEFKIYKNTLVRLATAASERTAIDPLLEGPTGIAFVKSDVAAVAKVLRDFARTNPALVVKGSYVSGNLLDAGTTARLAELPSRETLLSQIAGTLAAPLQNFAGLLKAVPQNLAFGISALLEKKRDSEGQSAAAAPLAEAPAEPEAAEPVVADEATREASSEAASETPAEPEAPPPVVEEEAAEETPAAPLAEASEAEPPADNAVTKGDESAPEAGEADGAE